MDGATRTCIYCGAHGAAVVFTREHVLQRGFGAFKHALVLHDAVCHECNQFFARTIDLALTRESAEGLERYRSGLKDPAEITNFRFRSMQLRAQDAADFTDVPVRLVEHDGRLLAQPRDGAAIRNREDDGFTHFTVDEILQGKWAEESIDWRKGVRLYGDDTVVQRMLRALEARGVALTNFRPLQLPQSTDSVEVAQVFSITRAMKRGIAKIAFNYLALSRGSAFARMPSFDPIRQFIRYDIQPALEPLKSTFEMPFRTESKDRRPLVHWVSLSSHQAHRNLLGTVMLLGFMDHTVVLAQNFAGPWFDLPVAHMYNVKTMTVSEVEPVLPRWRHADS